MSVRAPRRSPARLATVPRASQASRAAHARVSGTVPWGASSAPAVTAKAIWTSNSRRPNGRPARWSCRGRETSAATTNCRPAIERAPSEGSDPASVWCGLRRGNVSEKCVYAKGHRDGGPGAHDQLVALRAPSPHWSHGPDQPRGCCPARLASIRIATDPLSFGSISLCCNVLQDKSSSPLP